MRHIILLFFISFYLAYYGYGGTIHIINNDIPGRTKVGQGQVLLDLEDKYTIQQISGPSLDSHFKTLSTKNFEEKYLTYWVKFTLRWEVETSLVLSTPLACKRIELYIPNNHGGYDKKTSGVDIPFWEKHYKTNRHSFSLYHGELGKLKTYYLKVVSYSGIIPLIINTNERFTNDRIADYFFQGLMFGIVFVAGFYNLILFLKLRESAYLYYSLYVVFFGLFGLLIWHYQYNFLWWLEIDLTIINLIFNIVYCLITTFFLLYAKNFFYFKNKGSFLDRAFKYLIWMRIICFFLGLLLAPVLKGAWIDTVILFPVFIIAYYSYKKRFLPSKNFIFAFTALFVGMFIHSISGPVLEIYPSFKSNHIFFICGSTGMFLFSLSLGERMQLLLEEKDKTKTQLILQLKHNETLKNDQNQELEKKVKERTTEIEERNKQLDTFVYRASHDIKGPLRSILGLSKLGALEAPDDRTKDYFDHISKSSSKLDATLADLLNVVKMNHAKIESEEINFSQIIDEILSSFQHHPHFHKISFAIDVDKNITFCSDFRLLYSIFQNLIENSINYIDLDKCDHFLRITIATGGECVIASLEDNGIGIDEKYKGKIFEMFFKIDDHSSGTGLGMYLVKQTLERLGGTITMESELGVGTKFILMFNNKVSSLSQV